MPKGWPIDTDPPLTFTFSGSILRKSMLKRDTTAKASLISQRSMSFTVRLWRFSRRGTAIEGPIPISSGEHPPTANPSKRPRGVRPRRSTSFSSISKHALAPSDNWDALPAVTVALGSFSPLSTLSFCRLSIVVSPLLHSSFTTVYFWYVTSFVSLFVTAISVSRGTISSLYLPACCAAKVRCCDISAYASCRSREIPYLVATRSAVSIMGIHSALYTGCLNRLFSTTPAFGLNALGCTSVMESTPPPIAHGTWSTMMECAAKAIA
mmetsp:Transcript_4223/g.6200  ORF Transcript_4223/g.6200 Transcript_4223/m.6200 type:complete len:266 (+) Transcript_4223:318-1115(+)